MPDREEELLPDELTASSARRGTLAAMYVGEAAYTTYWAMSADLQRKCWLNPNYPAKSQPSGTVEMRVERRKDGYHVWVPQGASWEPIDLAGRKHLPVAKIHW